MTIWRAWVRTAERSSILNLSLKKTSLPTFDIRCLLINRNPKDTPRSGAGVKMPKLRIELGTFTSGARRSPNWAIAAPPPAQSAPPHPVRGALQRESKGAQGGRGRGAALLVQAACHVRTGAAPQLEVVLG